MNIAIAEKQAITDNIRAANLRGYRPVLISVGLDGFACKIPSLKEYLESSTLDFTLVLRERNLDHGLSPRFWVEHKWVSWYAVDSTDLLQGPQQKLDVHTRGDICALISTWDQLQTLKDEYRFTPSIKKRTLCHRNYLRTAKIKTMEMEELTELDNDGVSDENAEFDEEFEVFGGEYQLGDFVEGDEVSCKTHLVKDSLIMVSIISN